MIPNIFHFVYIKERPWKLHHYLSVKSAVVRSGVEKVIIWVDEEPEGKYWDKTKEIVEVQRVKLQQKYLVNQLHNLLINLM